jgi:glutamate N-acetyltransferase / amino-acid N-acetyltransferase
MNAASALATMPVPSTMHLPKGFSFSAAVAGIKVSGRPDLALIAAQEGTTAAALFTQNRVVAAPVQIGRANLTASHGRVRGVLVNSGNANCATGAAGLRACKNVCREAGKLLGVNANQIFPSSTGIIGVPFPEIKVVNALPTLLYARANSDQSALSFADAILTTDTRRKLSSAQFSVGKARVNLLGIAKGSGMIHPNLATMLVYILTDVQAGAGDLKKLLREACAESFNSMSVDGDTSTNDTVLLLASGSSGTGLSQLGVRNKFAEALNGVCASLSDQIVSDGEGVQHVIRLRIEQAKSREEALQIARAIAHSLLVKTAWAGADPNWGRILSSVGNSGVPITPERVSIFVGKQMVCKNGGAYKFDEAQAHNDLDQPECDIRVQLGRGKAGLTFTTTDLTAEYVRINADYST